MIITLGKFTEVNEEQLLNAEFPILVTLGKLIEVNEEQLLNTESPILVTNLLKLMRNNN